MGDLAIRVDALSKRYHIGQRERYDSLRESLTDALCTPFRRVRSLVRRRSPSAGKQQADDQEVWALRNVSFEVEKGEVIGIIGRNGAGKTTLLKVLSRITEPTGGRADIYGRVGSLLEVGTGFHPQLTGRENIYLNGSILGMKKREIDHKFDEIVAFAEIERFIDTPVRFYSSGMYVRLAFAVAAHLEPEILLVDEVLAVGDYEFQKKCLGKMRDVGREGRTVLLVSHSLASILNLCPRAILLDAGEVLRDDRASEVVQHYIKDSSGAGGEVVWSDAATAPGSDKVRLRAVRILCDGYEPTSDVDIQKDILIQIEFWNLMEGAKLYACVHLRDQMETVVFASHNWTSNSLTEDPWFDRASPAGLFISECRIPGNFLNEGIYRVTAIVGTNVTYEEARVDGAVTFRVFDSGPMRKEFGGGWIGVVRPRLAWRTKYEGPFAGELELTPERTP